ncbi:hypothetical protein [Pseudomonas nitroreducens]|uniref:hypothetical protein n=1 Tax=Pseudomonas nitroreducens TaxID=46680 RepID=UPI0011304232|nr:hypothetical protein [Pseudomonas nitroreducens]
MSTPSGEGEAVRMLEMRHSMRHQKSLIGLTYLSFTGLAALPGYGMRAMKGKKTVPGPRNTRAARATVRLKMGE